ncbi:MAG: ComEA family DNA-binding protein [Anaerolineales bacterium]|nr:ComEA family DNA-binding protein [Anaerolineales bacterium]
MKNALYVLLGVMAGFVLAGALVFVSRAPQGEPILLQPAPTKAPLAVHVIGAVPRPGLYELAEGARVQDGIDAAGGLLAEASVETLNLAALLVDGQQLIVPYKDGREVLSTSEPVLPTDESVYDPCGDGSLVNINDATAQELADRLNGIGEKTAANIVDYRVQNGEFYTTDDVEKVTGIGPVTILEIQDFICFGPYYGN